MYSEMVSEIDVVTCYHWQFNHNLHYTLEVWGGTISLSAWSEIYKLNFDTFPFMNSPHHDKVQPTYL